MAGVDINFDSAELEEKLKQLEGVKKGADKAMKTALNKGVTGMDKDAWKQIKKHYTITEAKEKFDERIKIQKPSVNNLSAFMRSQGRSLSLAKFKHEHNPYPGKKGTPTVFAQAKKSSSGKHITGAFMATMENGHEGVFVRTGKVKGGKVVNLLHSLGFFKNRNETITEKYGPAYEEMLNNDEIKELLQEKAIKRFNTSLDKRITELLNKAASGGE